MKLLHLTNHYPPYSSGVPDKQCRLVVHELNARNHVNRVLTSDIILPGLTDREPHVWRRLRLSTEQSASTIFRLLLMERHNQRVLVEALEQLMPDIVVVWGMQGLSHALLWEIERRGFRVAFAVLDSWPRHRLRDDAWYQWWYGTLPFDQRLFRRIFRELRLDRTMHRHHPARRPTEMPLRPSFFASRVLRDSVQLAGFDVTGSEIIPHCLPRDEIPAQPQRREELRRLLWIGKLDTDRDPMTAVQAVQELRHRGEMRFSLDIFGRGDPAVENRVRDYVRNAQLGGAVTIRQATIDEMVMLFPTYDIFLHTARHPDSFPLVLLRAMAARLPIVATPEGSAADVLRNGDNALTFRAGDPPDCAEKILRLVADRPMLDAMAERAYRELLARYTVGAVTGRIERLLQEAIRHRGS